MEQFAKHQNNVYYHIGGESAPVWGGKAIISGMGMGMGIKGTKGNIIGFMGACEKGRYCGYCGYGK